MIRAPLPFIIKKPKFPKIKGEQRESRRISRMTLVAALSGHEGVVFFADREEVVAGYSKKEVDKLTVWDCPEQCPIRFAIAGATDDGAYADSLQSAIAASLLRMHSFNITEINHTLNETLTEFYGKHIWPRAAQQPSIELLIVIQPQPSGTPAVFHSSNTAVNIMGTTTHWKSVGVGSYLADYIFNMALGGGEPISQLAATAVYAAKEVRENVQGVGELNRVVVFRNDGMYDELDSSDIEKIEKNILNVKTAIGELFENSFQAGKAAEWDTTEEIVNFVSDSNYAQTEWYKKWLATARQRKNLLEIYAQRIRRQA